jgi:hypothetical protein
MNCINLVGVVVDNILAASGGQYIGVVKPCLLKAMANRTVPIFEAGMSTGCLNNVNIYSPNYEESDTSNVTYLGIDYNVFS